MSDSESRRSRPPDAFFTYLNTAPGRLALVQIALAVAMASGMMLSSPLWIAHRDYPLAPVATWLPHVPPGWDELWRGAIFCGLAAMALAPRWRWPVWCVIGLILPLAMLDQNRWQPWAFEYVALMLVIGFRAPLGADVSSRDATAQNACRIILAMTYVYSGLQKCNASFMDDTGPWILAPVQDVFERFTIPGSSMLAAAVQWVRDHSYLMPIGEIALGAMLFVPRLRIFGVAIAIAMHLLLLFVLGPLGFNRNSVVWPWNVAMMALVVILFFGSAGRAASLREGASSIPYWIAVVLFGIMPALSFFHFWDSYLSSALYSGNTLQAEIEMRYNLYDRLPERAKKFCKTTTGVYYTLDPWDWAMEELNVPPYPEKRVYLSLARQLAAGAEQADDCILVFDEWPPITSTSRRTIRIECGR